MTIGAIDREATEKAASQIDPLKMPEPAGYKILITLPKVAEQLGDSGLVRADSTKKAEETASCLGFVLKLGPMAYRGAKFDESGPWCKEGDFIIMRNYSGTRFKIHGEEFRLINDDQVEAVVDDPRGYTRA
jgi:co-chaperonin GroES (HSP10)